MTHVLALRYHVFRFLSFMLAVSVYDVLWLSRYDLYD
jgi:hypothetical protein